MAGLPGTHPGRRRERPDLSIAEPSGRFLKGPQLQSRPPERRRHVLSAGATLAGTREVFSLRVGRGCPELAELIPEVARFACTRSKSLHDRPLTQNVTRDHTEIPFVDGPFGASGEASAALESAPSISDGSPSSTPAHAMVGIRPWFPPAWRGAFWRHMSFRWPTTTRSNVRGVPTEWRGCPDRIRLWCNLACGGVTGAFGHLVPPTPSRSSTSTPRLRELRPEK